MQAKRPQTMGISEWLLLVVLSILWGGSFFFNEVALRDLPPFTLVLGRVGLAAIALNILVRIMGHSMPGSLKAWLPLIIMGALNNLIPFCLIVWGQASITSGLASVLNASTPLFTLLLAHLLTRDEKLSLAKLSGIILGMAGVCLIMGLEALEGLGLKLLAQAAVLSAALCYACAAIFGRRFKSSPPLVTACGQVTASAVMLLPLSLWIDRPWRLPAPDLATWGAVLGLAFISTALAYIIYFRILHRAGATNLALVTLLIPVSATLLGSLVLGEAVSGAQLWGMGLISLALLAVDGRLLRPGRT
jgi:drug/metabolite transporter (DMT)-like permease